jgi:hypothetical protein
VAPNLPDRQIADTAPDRIRVTDIIDRPVDEGSHPILERIADDDRR